jgi:archaellum biogenesis protein FlaJ (TadC family)
MLPKDNYQTHQERTLAELEIVTTLLLTVLGSVALAWLGYRIAPFLVPFIWIVRYILWKVADV